MLQQGIWAFLGVEMSINICVNFEFHSFLEFYIRKEREFIIAACLDDFFFYLCLPSE